MATLALGLLGALLALFVLGWAHLRYWHRRLTLALPYASSDTLTMPDGGRIELHRVPRPAGAPPPAADEGLPPVLLVHGLGANHRNHDLSADVSLARHLAALGRDVWLLNLRSGVGGWTRRDAARVRFEAMVRHDVPRAVAAVRERTGAAQVDYVGFSMGGMLLYGALGRTLPAEEVRRAVIVGSPGRISAPRLLRPLLRRVPRWAVPASRNKLAARAAAFMVEWVSTPYHRLFYNPDNVGPGLVRLSLMNVVEDVPAALNADFLAWAAADGAVRVDGERAVDGLAAVEIPALFFAGNADRMAPPAAVRMAFDAWGRDRPGVAKRLIVLGKELGYLADYGHGDMAMGTHVATEIFGPIARFLDAETASAAMALLPPPADG